MNLIDVKFNADRTSAECIEVRGEYKVLDGYERMTIEEYEKWAASVPQIVDEPEPAPVVDPVAPDITLEQLTQWVADKFGVDVSTVKAESAVRSSNYVSKAP